MPANYRVAQDDKCLKCGAKGVFRSDPPICMRCRRNQTLPEEDEMDFRIALRDANTQRVLKRFQDDLNGLMDEYDMDETIFGEQLRLLMWGYGL